MFHPKIKPLNQLVGVQIRTCNKRKYYFNSQGVITSVSYNKKPDFQFGRLADRLLENGYIETDRKRNDITPVDYDVPSNIIILSVKKILSFVEDGLTYQEFCKLFDECLQYTTEHKTSYGFEDRHKEEWQSFIHGVLMVTMGKSPENNGKRVFDYVKVRLALYNIGNFDLKQKVWQYRQQYINSLKQYLQNYKGYTKYNVPVQFLKCVKIIPVNSTDFEFIFELREV